MKVRCENGGGWYTLHQSEKQIFPTVEKARAFYKKKLETNKVVLCYAEKKYKVKKVEKSEADNVRDYNVGASDYAKHKIQPWDIWLEYKLNPWDADIIKRVLRDKPTDGRKLDYEKIIHICKERIRQLENGE